jgi:amino acid transporter
VIQRRESVSRSEESKTKNEKKEKKLKISLLSSAVWAFFILALAAGARLLYDYASGFISTEGLLAGVEEVIFYLVISVALLLIRIITRSDEKRPSEKRKNSLLSLILSFCLPFALTLFLLSILSGYSFSDIIDTFSLPEITVYVAVGGGLLLAHILTRESRKRKSKNSPEQEGKECVPAS